MFKMSGVISLGVLLALLIFATGSWFDLSTSSLLLRVLWIGWIIGGFTVIIWLTHRRMLLWKDACEVAEQEILRLHAQLESERQRNK